MATHLFTKEFYQEVYKQMLGRLEEDFCPSREVEETDGYAWLEDEPFCDDGECIEVEAKVVTYNEWEDASFDHAFGTWYDPNPYWKFCGITELTDVHVHQYGEKDELEGWNDDDFWKSFYEEEYKGALNTFKAGDKVQYMFKGHWYEDVGTFKFHDTFNWRFLVQVGNELLHCQAIRVPTLPI